MRSQATRVLGLTPSVHADVWVQIIDNQDAFLLCTSEVWTAHGDLIAAHRGEPRALLQDLDVAGHCGNASACIVTIGERRPTSR